MKWAFLSIGVVACACVILVLMALGPTGRDPTDAAAAQEAARSWTGQERTDPPRKLGEGWEVDVRRPDGSVVEVNLGRDLELVELDEELGPGGTPAHDEAVGDLRERAIAAALRHSGRGEVRSVERERDGSYEVDVVRPDGTMVEVDLDDRLEFGGIEHEELGDE